jgi:hypothetical protein
MNLSGYYKRFGSKLDRNALAAGNERAVEELSDRLFFLVGNMSGTKKCVKGYEYQKALETLTSEYMRIHSVAEEFGIDVSRHDRMAICFLREAQRDDFLKRNNIE